MNAQKDKDVRVILLTGTGEKDFCTGIDVDAAKELSPAGRENLLQLAGDIATLFYYGKPVVIAINGRVMGMGVVFATAADFRLMAQHATFQMPEVKAGIFTGAGCTVIMARTCGIAWARRILMGGTPFMSQDAIAAHVADELVPKEQLMERATNVAKDYSIKNQVLLKAIKFAINHTCDMPYMQGIALEVDLAGWHKWSEAEKRFAELEDKYALTHMLTGNPDQLLSECMATKDT